MLVSGEKIMVLVSQELRKLIKESLNYIYSVKLPSSRTTTEDGEVCISVPETV
jgi:hypothetical protein